MSESSQGKSLVQVTTLGLITAETVQDDSLVGYHEVSFEAYLLDYGSGPEYAKEISFKLRVIVEDNLTELQKTILMIVEGSLTRFQPISVNALAPQYLCYTTE